MSGFTYNGIHCSTYGIDYVPDASARWWEEASFETYKQDVAWRSGGYWYGTSVGIREISLDCYFNEISIETREKIRKWLGRTTSGQLVFDDRPFVYYDVRPDKVVPGKIYNDINDTHSGTFTVTFVATEPFGYLTRKYNTGSETDDADDYCALIAQGLMPDAPTTSSRTFYVYNPGTEPCGLIIRIAGTAGKPIRFYNQTNGTQCVISSLPSNSLILDLNGDTGMVKTYASGSPGTYSNGFAYHDYGMVRLEPDEAYHNMSYVSGTSGSYRTVKQTVVPVTDRFINGYIKFNTPATRNATVGAIDTSTNALLCTLGGSGTFQSTGTIDTLMTRNKIVIEEKNTSGNWVTPTALTLTSIAMDYAPRLSI